MSQDRDDFLSRWSRRKNAARAGIKEEPPVPAVAAPAVKPPAEVAGEAPPPEPLPPVESLTPESDFTPFMRSDVDPTLRQQALRTLFRDPRFNVQDGLDVYIADFSQPDPIPPEWLGQLNQMARLGDYRPPEEAEEALAEAAANPDPEVISQAEHGVGDEVPSDLPPVSDAESSLPELKQS